jgi:hypothetical protein
MDPSVAPGDDFFRYCERQVAREDRDPARSCWHVVDPDRARAQTRTRTLLDQAAKRKAAAGCASGRMGPRKGHSVNHTPQKCCWDQLVHVAATAIQRRLGPPGNSVRRFPTIERRDFSFTIATAPSRPSDEPSRAWAESLGFHYPNSVASSADRILATDSWINNGRRLRPTPQG